MPFTCAGCSKVFMHPAKYTDVTGQSEFIELLVCPFCKSKEHHETVEPQPEHVYIYELTSGAQTELDKLLAEGYTVVARYSKQYHLEKPKAEAVKDYVAEVLEVVNGAKQP